MNSETLDLFDTPDHKTANPLEKRSENPPAKAFEDKANLHREKGEHEKAVTAYNDALNLLSSDPKNSESAGRIWSSLAVIHELEGRTVDAKSSYERAIACFEKLTPPALLDIADLSNNLAFIFEAEDNFDQAETLLLNALKISHETLGEKHEQTAALCNNVASLYFKAGHETQARKMHMMALEAREELFGDHHLETAQSHGNLALVLFKSEDYDACKRHFERALHAYEGNLAEGRDHYEIVAANYRDVLEFLNEDKAVQALDARLSTKKA